MPGKGKCFNCGKLGSDTIKGEGDTALEAEAQLYSYIT